MSDLKVVDFKSTQASGDFVVKRLEEALAMAKDGNVENIMIVAACADGTVLDCWANQSVPFTMVGALESVKREFMDACIETRE